MSLAFNENKDNVKMIDQSLSKWNKRKESTVCKSGRISRRKLLCQPHQNFAHVNFIWIEKIVITELSLIISFFLHSTRCTISFHDECQWIQHSSRVKKRVKSKRSKKRIHKENTIITLARRVAWFTLCAVVLDNCLGYSLSLSITFKHRRTQFTNTSLSRFLIVLTLSGILLFINKKNTVLINFIHPEK